MYQILAYIKFILKSTNQHGVHSPFVYKLVTKCFYDRSDYSLYKSIKTYRNGLFKNNQSIVIKDLGAGSKVFKSNERIIKKIAKTSGSSLKRSKLLFGIVKYFKPESILELGTSLGIATYSMALGNDKAKIVSIEGCPNSSEFTKHYLKDHNVTNVELIVGSFQEKLRAMDEPKWDLVFFDGHHNKSATLNYFELLLSKAHNESIFIFDDIHWSKDMSEAWESIKQHPNVKVTIDTFFWGLVFFRNEQVKEHFTIRL